MINWIITSSILIVGVIILRRILRGRISLRLQYALWGLVLLRLLLPVSVGATTFSVENTVQSVPAVQHFAQRMASPAQSGNPEKPAAPAGIFPVSGPDLPRRRCFPLYAGGRALAFGDDRRLSCHRAGCGGGVASCKGGWPGRAGRL